MKAWTGLDFNSSQRAAEDRQRWQKIVAEDSSGVPMTRVVPGHRFEFTSIHLAVTSQLANQQAASESGSAHDLCVSAAVSPSHRSREAHMIRV